MVSKNYYEEIPSQLMQLKQLEEIAVDDNKVFLFTPIPD